MIDHLPITVTDIDRQAFYDPVLRARGYPRVHRRAEAIGYGVRDHSPGAAPYISIYLCTERLVADNRHWCFRAPGRAAVRAFHQAALAHGGSDDGPPGIREKYSPDYYAAFVRDPDGNRLEAVTRQPEGPA